MSSCNNCGHTEFVEVKAYGQKHWQCKACGELHTSPEHSWTPDESVIILPWSKEDEKEMKEQMDTVLGIIGKDDYYDGEVA